MTNKIEQLLCYIAENFHIENTFNKCLLQSSVFMSLSQHQIILMHHSINQLTLLVNRILSYYIK